MNKEVSVLRVRKKMTQVLGQEQSTYTERSGRASLRRQRWRRNPVLEKEQPCKDPGLDPPRERAP